MPAILTVTLNPTVDLSTAAPDVVPGLKLRCSAPQVDPGGGGINVSRAIKLLGGRSTALVAIGGASGARLLELLTQEGIATIGFQGPGETRLSLSVTDAGTGDQYRFVLPGPDWTERDVARALDTLDQATGSDTLVVLSGSQPPGVAKNFPAILAEHVSERAARLIVDTSGPALFNLVEAPHPQSTSCAWMARRPRSLPVARCPVRKTAPTSPSVSFSRESPPSSWSPAARTARSSPRPVDAGTLSERR
jgi:6-phosphofructokinase 2